MALSDGSEKQSSASRDPVEKALEVLRWMIDQPADSWGVRELARSLGRPPSTVYRALARLESEGFVALDQRSGRYGLGLEMHRLAAKVTARFSLREAAMPTLIELSKQFNETTFLGLLDRGRLEMMMVSTVESTHELRYVVALNEWRPLYLGGSGVAILAFLPEETRAEVLSRVATNQAAVTGRVTEAHVRAVVAKARELGYARTLGERVPDAVGIAAPIYDPDRRVIGSVGVTLPSSRFSGDREPKFAQAVVAAADRVTRELIY